MKNSAAPDEQARAVLARLQEAYSVVALCETWLAMNAAKNPIAHQWATNRANDRQLELGREVRKDAAA